MDKKLTILVLFSFLSLSVFSQDEGHTKIIYKYKKYQKIDLGDFSIKGKISTPGDLTVKERDRKQFSGLLYHREEFAEQIREDIWDVR